MSFCASSRKPDAPLLNLMSSEDFKKKTDNYEKVMNRTWYCIANNMGGNPHVKEVMWELNTWNSADHALGKNCFTNHTITRSVGAATTGINRRI